MPLEIQQNNLTLYLTTIYTNADYRRRRDLWASLDKLHDHYFDPWMFVGDFNAVLVVHDKKG